MTKLKVDRFGDANFREMYSLHASATFEDFQKWCIEKIQNNTVCSKLKKQEFADAIRACTNKDRIVLKMSNFMLAGEGHKVYKVT